MRLATALLLISVFPSIGTAQRQRFDVQQFLPGMTHRSSTIGLYQARVLAGDDFDMGLVLHWSDAPLVLRSNTTRFAEVVGGQLTGHVVGGFGIYDFAEFLVDIPFVLHQTGDPIPILPNLDVDATGAGFGMGDLRAAIKFQLVGTTEECRGCVLMAGVVSAQFPTGKRRHFQGGEFRPALTIALDAVGKREHRMTLNVGYTLRPSAELFGGLDVDDTLDYGLALDVRAAAWMHVIAELRGHLSVLADDIGIEEAPMEFDLGIRMNTHSTSLMLAGGIGLTNGFGTPDYRVIVTASYLVTRRVIRFDYDDDGFFDHDDRCPHQAEDGAGPQDGCPGIADDEPSSRDTQPIGAQPAATQPTRPAQPRRPRTPSRNVPGAGGGILFI